MYNVDFFMRYKHDEDTWRGVTSSHPIPEFPVVVSQFEKNPHNYRRFYSISSYEGVINVKTINTYDLYMRDSLSKEEYVFYKDMETIIDSKSFDNLMDALNYLKDNYNVKINGV